MPAEATGGTDPARDEAEGRRVADRILAVLGRAAPAEREAAAAEALAALPESPETAAVIAVELQRRVAAMSHAACSPLARGSGGGSVCESLRAVLRAVAQRKPDFSDGDLAALATLVPRQVRAWENPASHVHLPLAAFTQRLERRPGDPAALAAVRSFLACVESATQADPTYADRTTLLVRIRGLLSGGGDLRETAERAFADGDAWGPPTRAAVVERFSDAPGARDLLAFATRRIPSKVPTARWRKECAGMLARCPATHDVLRAALEPLLETPDTPYTTPYGTFAFYLTHENAETAKTLLWMLAVARPDWAPRFLAELALHCAPGPRDQKLANASVLVLGDLGDRAAVGQLARVRLRMRNRGALKQVDQALEAAAARAGVPSAELLEMCVPDFGLDASGRKEVAVGDAVAVLRVEGPSVASLSWRDASGRDVSAPPAALRETCAAEVASLKAELKELRTTLGTERTRLEDLFASERTWTVPVWSERYVRHPVTGPVARGLLWSVPVAGGGRRTGLLAPDPLRMTDVAGAPFTADPAGDGVRLWHPIHATADEVEAWRARVVASEIAQPVKQAFREVYALTPAEEQTAVYSNRFAGHVLRYPQASALIKARGWHANSLGGWDGGHEGIAKREFRDAGLRAEFFHDLVDDGDGGLAALCTTDQVRFFRRTDAEHPVPLADVPAVVFSEAMRDVDLFVSVASIETDPNWIDRGEHRTHDDTWNRTSFGELRESGRSRRDALVRILPRLRIAKDCTVEDRWLVVRGALATYRIHLGSGNVQMEPGSRYLCIVADRGRPRSETTRVFLPFEGDGTLSVILSKAFLLADDARITDPTILRQIRGG